MLTAELRLMEFGHSTLTHLLILCRYIYSNSGILPAPPAAGTTASTDINDAVG